MLAALDVSILTFVVETRISEIGAFIEFCWLRFPIMVDGAFLGSFVVVVHSLPWLCGGCTFVTQKGGSLGGGAPG